MNTGEIIKYFRLARNMTQEQLAQDAEISFSTLRKYEANERNPKYEQLSKIADGGNIFKTRCNTSDLILPSASCRHDLLHCQYMGI